MLRINNILKLMVGLTAILLILVTLNLSPINIFLVILPPFILILSYVISLYFKRVWIGYILPTLLIITGLAFIIIPLVRSNDGSFGLAVMFMIGIFFVLSSLFCMLIFLLLRRSQLKFKSENFNWIIIILLPLLIFIKYEKFFESTYELNYFGVYGFTIIFSLIFGLILLLFKSLTRKHLSNILSVCFLIVSIISFTNIEEFSKLVFLGSVSLTYFIFMIITSLNDKKTYI